VINLFSTPPLRFALATFQRTKSGYIAFLPIALWVLSSLSSCQRAPQAYVARTYHPPAQRLAAPTPQAEPTTNPQLTASLTEDIPLSNPSILERATEPASELAVVPVVRQSNQHHPSRRAVRRPAATAPCDQIVLRNGDVIEAKVKEVGVNEIKYKKCDRADGPDYTVSKRDVLSIKYSNGEVERFSTSATPSNNTSSSNRSAYDSPTNPANDGPKTDPFAIVAISAGALAVLTGYGAFLLGAVGIVFGALSLTRIRKEPGRFKGKGLAIGGMVAGLVSAAIVLLYIIL
jgi:hypothetical protein